MGLAPARICVPKPGCITLVVGIQARQPLQSPHAPQTPKRRRRHRRDHPLMASEFPPTAVTHNGSDYTGAVTAIDEFPPAGGGAGERLQSAPTANGAARLVTIDFDLTTADEFREITLLLRHLTTITAGSGWSTSAQLIVNGSNEGSPVVVSMSTPPLANQKYTRFRWPSSVNAAVAADPSTVQVALTSTNNTGVSALHHIDMARMYTSPFTATQEPWGIPTADIIEGWDALWTQNELAYWTDGGPVTLVPALKGGDHMLLHNTGTAVFEDDGALPAAIIPTDARWTTQLPANYTDFWRIGVIRTPNPVPTNDGNSQVEMTGSNEWHNGGTTNNKVFITGLAANASGTGGSWVLMCSPDGAETDHIRGTVTVPADTEFVVLCRLDSSANEKMWVCDGGVFADDAILVLDGQGLSGNNTLQTVDWAARESNERFWAGQLASMILLDPTLTETEAMSHAQTLGEAYGILNATPGTSTNGRAFSRLNKCRCCQTEGS